MDNSRIARSVLQADGSRKSEEVQTKNMVVLSVAVIGLKTGGAFFPHKNASSELHKSTTFVHGFLPEPKMK